MTPLHLSPLAGRGFKSSPASGGVRGAQTLAKYRFPYSPTVSFDQFALEQETKIQLKAIYTETNGFFINFDRWYFDIFGYTDYGGHENYDWLSHWQAVYKPSIQLVGMEPLQRIFQDVAESGVYDGNLTSDPKVKALETAKDYVDLLVVLRFQDLIHRSVPLMQKVKVPVLATAHDYDFIYEVDPLSLRRG